MAPAQAWSEQMADLLATGEFSDMEINCNGTTFNVHRVVVCSQSSFFKKAMTSGFKESHDQRVDLPADDVCTIKRVVTFMYTQDYDEEYPACDREDNEFSELCPLLDATNTTSIHGTVAQAHLKVYQAADKFGIEHLKPLVIDKLAKWVESVLHSDSFLPYVTEIIKMAPAHDKALVHMLANTITKYFRHFQAHKEDDLKDFIMENRPIGSLILINLIEEGRITGQKQEQVAKLWRLLTDNSRTQAKCPSCHCNLRVIL